MRDEYLKAAMRPANFVLALSRGEHPQSWRFRNISPGYNDLYEAMAFADREHKRLADCRKHILRCEGAIIVEFAIVRPTWEEIEEISF